MRHARSESEKAVLEARTAGRELALSQAESEGLTAAMVKAEEAIGVAPSPFAAGLISHGLARHEARRVGSWYLAAWRLDRTQYETANQKQRIDQDVRLRALYSSGIGRLFWDHFGRGGNYTFAEHVNRLIAEADQEALSSNATVQGPIQ